MPYEDYAGSSLDKGARDYLSHEQRNGLATFTGIDLGRSS